LKEDEEKRNVIAQNFSCEVEKKKILGEQGWKIIEAFLQVHFCAATFSSAPGYMNSFPFNSKYVFSLFFIIFLLSAHSQIHT
jgi:hypothetical protein